MKAAVVILNWNGQGFLEKFLPSVFEYTPNGIDIVVADNASTDSSLYFLASHYPQVQILENQSNLGYAGGYNVALKQLKHDVFILLNSDVEVTPGWTDSLMEVIIGDEKIAAVQPKIMSYHAKEYFEYAGAAGGYIDNDYYAFCRGRIFSELERDTGQYEGIQEVYWASGACMVVRAEYFFKAGGFDERFFAHMEEIDLCARFKNMGYKVMYTSFSTVYHVGGGTLSAESPFKTYLNFRNNLALITKNHNHSPLFAKLLKRVILDGAAAVQKAFQGNIKGVLAIFRAHMAFYLLIPYLLKQRRLIKAQGKNPNQEGVYPHSIIVSHFIKGNKKFNELKFNKLK